MKKITMMVLALFFVSVSAQAARFRLTDERVRHVDLRGINIVDSERNGTFPYAVKVLEEVTPEIEKVLGAEIAAEEELLSRVFVLDQGSAFKNIFVFMTKNNVGKYQLYVVYLNNSGSTMTVDYDVVAATQNSLTVKNGSSDDVSTYKVSTGRPLFDR